MVVLSTRDKQVLVNNRIRCEAEKEVQRLSKSIEWVLSKFRDELSSEPRQAFEKAFLAWKAAVALLVARYILENPDPEDPITRKLIGLGVVSISGDGEVEVRVKTSNAVKALRVMRETRLARYAEEVLGVRDAAFKLHSSFYDDPEHSGYADIDEAVKDAKRVVDTVEKVAEALTNRNRPRE